MKVFNSLKKGLGILVLFVGLTAVFAVPSMFRCGGEVDPHGSSQFNTL